MQHQKSYLNCYWFQFVQVRVSLLLLVFNTFFLSQGCAKFENDYFFRTMDGCRSKWCNCSLSWTSCNHSVCTVVRRWNFIWVSPFLTFIFYLKNIWLHNLYGNNFIKWLIQAFFPFTGPILEKWFDYFSCLNNDIVSALDPWICQSVCLQS